MTKAEEFIHDCTRSCSNEILRNGSESFTNIPRKGEYNPWLTPDQARMAVEIAREEMIDKVKALLLSEVLPCFMHGGEADEVVAMLDEKLLKDE